MPADEHDRYWWVNKAALAVGLCGLVLAVALNMEPTEQETSTVRTFSYAPDTVVVSNEPTHEQREQAAQISHQILYDSLMKQGTEYCRSEPLNKDLAQDAGMSMDIYCFLRATITTNKALTDMNIKAYNKSIGVDK